ncbi:Voltage-dependent calcium channel type A subunit alpha-1 [Amphibalanus amphitrite]|uniref:Voltage-dependent calcium channel type A subunit alpha-1 n=1 Tax=Amphibalanus amphitrite TaxID=1232801 RepID=A0A6A4VMN5_AMPAM|nr:Voltage-dependent calcium channel type A subunit alpha-1 [Amphibalanus amphitrite]
MDVMLAAAQEARAREAAASGADPAAHRTYSYSAMAKKSAAPSQDGRRPTSLFIFSETNPIRRYTKFIIEWPYPFYAASLDH